MKRTFNSIISRLILLFLFFVALPFDGNSQVVLGGLAFDNCMNPIPNAGTYTASGTVNGKDQYVKGSNLRIIWSGSQWQIQGDDPSIGGVTWITAWFNNNNTSTPPADCWQASFGCFIPTLSGASAFPAVSVSSIALANSNPTSSSAVNFTVTFSGTINSLTTSNFSLSTTGVSGASISSVSQTTGSVWNVAVNTGSGDGNISLSMVNASGASAIICTLPSNSPNYNVFKTSTSVDLSAGDISFIGYNSSSSPVDSISFVVLKSGGLASGTKIMFTDNGWNNVLSSCTSNEGVMLWTASSSVAQFTKVSFTISSSAYTVTSGSASSISTSFMSLSTLGDQILAFQGNLVSPTFISAIHMNAETTGGSLTGWDDFNNGASTTRSAIPSGLTNGTDAIMVVSGSSAPFTEYDNAVYNCTGATNATSLSAMLSSINDRSNWSMRNTTPYALPPACTFSINTVLTATRSQTDESCSGACDGSATVTPSGGTTPYTYSWSPSGGSGATASNLCSGTYTCIITDGASDTIHKHFTIIVGATSEANVQGNSVSIADNDATPTTADHTDFGDQSVCSGTLVRTFTIQNTGTASLTLSNPTLSGTNSSDFSVTANPSSPVSASGSTTFQVTFNPSALGLRSAAVSFTTNDCDEGTYNFSIQGSGVDPEINVQGNSTIITDGDASPSSTDHTDFGAQNMSSGTVIRTFTIQNTGTSDLTISSVNISGAASGDFTITSSPSSPVAVSGSTTFQVTFDPSAIGVRNATITITTNDCDEGTYDFSITGVGSTHEINLQGNSTSITDGDNTPSLSDHTAFGDLAPSASLTRTYTIQNTGTARLDISGISITGTHSSLFTLGGITLPDTVTAGGSKTFTITFNPTSGGVKTATITIASNDADEASYDFAVNGERNCYTNSIIARPTNDGVNTGGVSTNIYLGYGAQKDTLKAIGFGTNMSWSPGTNLSCTTCVTTVFAPTSAGTYTFTASNGCISNSISICVASIAAGGSGTTAKVYLCHKEPVTNVTQTQAVILRGVPSHFANHPGDKMGTCSGSGSGSGCTSNKRDLEYVDLVVDENDLEITCTPNPFRQSFKLNYHSSSADPASILIYGMTGNLIESRTLESVADEIELGHNLSNGIYTISFIQGDKNRVFKMIKVD